MMENSSNNYFKETYQLIEKYVDDRVSLIKIQTAKKTANLTSNIIFIFFISIILFFGLMFAGFMMAYFFAEKYNSNFYGFGIVSIVYLIILVLFIIFYKLFFSRKIKDMVTKLFFENEIDEEGEDYE